MNHQKEYLQGNTGFYIEKLILKNAFLFGETLELNFIDKNDFKELRGVLPNPYTTILIGPNGTGKSVILRTISEIFLELNEFSATNIENPRRYCWEHYEICYYIEGNYYEVKNYAHESDLTQKRKKYEYVITINGQTNSPINEIIIPKKLLVNSQLLTDRFSIFKESPEFYSYLGVRSLNSPTTARTRNYIKRTVDNVVNSLSDLDTGMLDNIRSLLGFLNYKEKFGIYYYPKYKQFFLTGDLTEKKFTKLFENYNDSERGFSKRKDSDYVPYNITFYKNHLANDLKKINEIVSFLNELRNDNHLKTEDERTRVEFFEFDILKGELSLDKYELLQVLYALDLITFPSIRLNKLGNTIDIENASSGEYHFISTMIGIYASINQNSLILIDEPEVSLHPNWQMNYMSFLKKVFEQYSTCHFILATHSHFFVSDLDGRNSKIIGLKRDEDTIVNVELPQGINTFGWAAEDVLYKIFEVRTTRNYYTEIDMRELLFLISENNKDKTKLEEIRKRLEKVSVSKDDPLNLILIKAQDYINSL